MTTLRYQLTNNKPPGKKGFSNLIASSREFYVYIRGDGVRLIGAFVLVLLNSIAGVVTPYVAALALDHYIIVRDTRGLAVLLGWLFGLFVFTMIVGYLQGRITGGISQRTLFRLRSALFDKLQSLPISFFNQNKAGDLMSRINNDTDKLNQFLSESIVRLAGSLFVTVGIAVFAIFINWRMGIAMLLMTVVLVVLTRILSPVVEKMNKKTLQSVGALSASLQENLSNFRIIIAYSKRGYFRNHLKDSSQEVFKNSLISDAANRVFEPIYDFAGAAAIIIVLIYGLHLMGTGVLTIGVLIAFLSYTQRFYDPLRTFATIFGTVQLSMAAWSRIRAVFALTSDLVVTGDKNVSTPTSNAAPIMELRGVTFGYEGGPTVIEDANLSFHSGKTYALVGPTGGGKSTLVSLMSRLYDPLSGSIYLADRDLRSYEAGERAKITSVILQDPILFAGTVAQNIKYGNDRLANMSELDLAKELEQKGFKEVIERFPQGLGTAVTQSSRSGLSLGQKQLISFMRAILREPKLLILDEATANIDTVTEALLTKALSALPKDTTKIIIAHRLNTIQDADEIMFVNRHHVTKAGDFHEALKLIEHSKRQS